MQMVDWCQLQGLCSPQGFCSFVMNNESVYSAIFLVSFCMIYWLLPCPTTRLHQQLSTLPQSAWPLIRDLPMHQLQLSPCAGTQVRALSCAPAARQRSVLQTAVRAEQKDNASASESEDVPVEQKAAYDPAFPKIGFFSIADPKAEVGMDNSEDKSMAWGCETMGFSSCFRSQAVCTCPGMLRAT